jgi:glycosyltransferase involved in cell wall biosynthesis
MRVIGHAVDHTQFYPLADKQQNRASVFPNEASDSFIVLNASRPCIRKRVDLTLRAFANFAKGKPATVKLCLHHAIEEQESRTLQDLIQQLGIEHRVLTNPLATTSTNVLSDADLNRLYNACDIGINSTMGEGWGLVSFEHAATGAAQIVPDHTACGLLWKGAASLVDCTTSTVGQISPFVMDEPSVESLTEALEQLYQNAEHRESTTQKCQKRSQPYPGNSIDKQWRQLLNDLSPLQTSSPN